jgi:nucleotide-binding universal stress UspA family protein
LAARTAADLAARSGSELHVRTVAPEIGGFDQLVGMQPVDSYVEILQAIEQETRRILEEQAKKIEEAGGTVEDTHLVDRRTLSRGGRTTGSSHRSPE